MFEDHYVILRTYHAAIQANAKTRLKGCGDASQQRITHEKSPSDLFTADRR